MPTHQLDRLLRLAQRTGGKLVITDAQGNQPVIILGLDEYEALLDAKPLKVKAPTPRSAVPQPRTVTPVEEPEADVTMMEEALMAAEEVIAEEPRVVPVKNMEPEVEATPIPVTAQRPGAAKSSNDTPGEEQFYLEPL